MPRLWNQTIDAHRRDVRDAILDTTAALVAERGLGSVTMSRIAEGAGIGRATLYKYFRDVDAILLAWHERHVVRHLEQLMQLRDRPGEPGERLEGVLRAYAMIAYHRARHGPAGLSALLHSSEQVADAQHQLVALFSNLLADAVAAGDVRDDVKPAELAIYCLHALDGAGGLRSVAAVRRLVTVTLAGLRPSR